MSSFRRLPRNFNVSSELLGVSGVKTVPTFELLAKLGFVRYPKSGLVHWLPIGTSILNKLTALIHRHMQLAGAEEVRMSNLLPATLWEQTARWKIPELFKLSDCAGSKYCLTATCEEDITALVASQISSYKNLPLLFYQINTKFRNELRPRAGLLRGREFIMKDAYSFDVSSDDAMNSYDTMVASYHRIFNELRVPYVKTVAASGNIGGSTSHEWHYIHQSGDDTIFTCLHCGNTLSKEKTFSYPKEDPEHVAAPEVDVKYLITSDRSTLVCAYFPRDRVFSSALLLEELPELDSSCGLTPEEILALFNDEDALLTKKVLRVMDLRLHSRCNFPDFPIKFVNRSGITTLTDIPIVDATNDEVCGHCHQGALKESRAIEVGHTFHLGDKYSNPLKCVVDLPKDNGTLQTVNVSMGCYGIGVSRLIAAIGEVNRDEHGFRWPACIAPWTATVINATSDTNKTIQLMSGLADAEIDALLDDRENIGLGRKAKEARVLGIPLIIIVGKKFPIVEIEIRGKKSSELWGKAHKENPEQWQPEYSCNGADVKHKVHVSRVGSVVNTLLKDM